MGTTLLGDYPTRIPWVIGTTLPCIAASESDKGHILSHLLNPQASLMMQP